MNGLFFSIRVRLMCTLTSVAMKYAIKYGEIWFETLRECDV